MIDAQGNPIPVMPFSLEKDELGWARVIRDKNGVMVFKFTWGISIVNAQQSIEIAQRMLNAYNQYQSIAIERTNATRYQLMCGRHGVIETGPAIQWFFDRTVKICRRCWQDYQENNEYTVIDAMAEASAPFEYSLSGAVLRFVAS